jgi:hypothetical protein
MSAVVDPSDSSSFPTPIPRARPRPAVSRFDEFGPLELSSAGKLYHPSGRDFYSMAVDTAKYGHAQVHFPVEYRPRVNFRPHIPAPLDFALRAAEVYHLDRELDRAVLHSNDFSDLVRETVGGQPGPAGMFRPERSGHRAAEFASMGRPPVEEAGGTRRQFLLNALRFSAESARFRPPWTVAMVQEAHGVLLSGLGLASRPGELRSKPYSGTDDEGEPIYTTCPPDRIAADLQALLTWIDQMGPTLMPIIPAAVLVQGFHSIRPFPVGNMTVARTLSAFYLTLFGLPNASLVPVADSTSASPELMLRLMLWTEASGSYSELVDYMMDTTLQGYNIAAARWLGGGEGPKRMGEVALRLLARARRASGWFSAQDAAGWIGGQSDRTTLHHLN